MFFDVNNVFAIHNSLIIMVKLESDDYHDDFEKKKNIDAPGRNRRTVLSVSRRNRRIGERVYMRHLKTQRHI
jgi:hypothetical protein